MADIVKTAGVSGNSVAGKGFQMFTVSEELLAKVTEAVQAGEKKARSSGDIQSFEVFCHGFRMNISLGRIMIVPPAVCNDRKNFPTALLHGALVRVFGTGGEEIADLVEHKIGDSEFDEYSQADFDTIKKSLFTDSRTEKEACLIVFAPNWMNSREYICFHFTKDESELKNNLRHQVFSAYYDPRVSSAFNAMMTNVNTTKVDVTDITPKMNFPFLAENLLKEYPELVKQASGFKKAHVLLNHKTADGISAETFDKGEQEVFDSLNQALENSLLPETESVGDAGARSEGGFKSPDAPDGVPRAASTKVAHGYIAFYGGKRIEIHADSLYAAKLKAIEMLKVPKSKQGLLAVELAETDEGGQVTTTITSSKKLAHIDANGICPGCKNAGNKCSCQNCTCKEASSKKIAYVAHVPGHHNSKGEAAPWVIKQHNTDKILESFKSESAAKEGLKNMESHKGSVTASAEVVTENPLASHEAPFSNVGPGRDAAAGQKPFPESAKESLEDAKKRNKEKATKPIGIEIDDTGRPVHKGDDVKEHRASTKKALVKSDNPKTNKHDQSHPETLRVGQERLSTQASELFNGGFVNKADWPPKGIAEYAGKHIGNNDSYAPHAVADHRKQIEAGAYGETPFDRKAQEKWGRAEKMANYVADIIAAGIEDDSEIGSEKSKAASKQHQSMLDKFRPKTAVGLDIDTIWDEITEDMGPAPLVEVESGDSNPAPSNTEGETRSGEGSGESSEGGDSGEGDNRPADGRPRKSDVSDLPEAMRSPEPEDTKDMSEPEAESQEDSMPHADSDTGENTAPWEKEGTWRVDSKLADFVSEVFDDVNNEDEVPEGRQRVHCDKCEMLSINGVPCHEQGCPNMGARWDREAQDWVKQRECFECGNTVDADDPCCSAPIEDEEVVFDNYDEPEEELVEASGEGEYVGDNNPAMMASTKTADTADNPANEDGGEGAISVKTNKVIKNTRGNEPPSASAPANHSKHADAADNDHDIDAAARPKEKELGKSDTLKKHEERDSKGQVYDGPGYTASKKKADTAQNPANEKGGEGSNELVDMAGKEVKNTHGTTVKYDVTGSKKASASPELKKKLHPQRFKGISGKMAAIVGYILDEIYTDPHIQEMAVTSDGIVMASQSGDIGMNDMIGSELDLQNNWKRLCETAGLDNNEMNEANSLFKEKILNYRTGNDFPMESEQEPTAMSGHGTASVKQADTADNPASMAGADGAIEIKTDRTITDTTGPTPDNTKKAYNQNQGVLQEVGEKHDHGIDGDLAQARSETDSPDTVDQDINQPTTSVLDAGKRKNSADISGDMAEAKSELTYNKAEIAGDPQADDTKSADQAGGRKNAGDLTPESIKQNTGIKQMVGPKHDQGIEGDMAQAEKAIDFNKAQIADEPAADDTVNPAHFAADKVRMKCNECGKRFSVSPNAADPECPKCHGVDWDVDDSKEAAAGDQCPEEIEIDLGAGDLADIVMTEETDESAN